MQIHKAGVQYAAAPARAMLVIAFHEKKFSAAASFITGQTYVSDGGVSRKLARTAT